MFRWLKGRKKDGNPPQAERPEPEPGAEDWDFLRAQPDHDADAMAAVHGPAEEEPSSEPVTALETIPVVQAEVDEPGLLDLPDPEEPRRQPRKIQHSIIPQAARAERADEHATKPLTLLSELCAKFQDPADVRPEWERAGGGAPGWTLTLEVTAKRRVVRKTVSEEATIGREDPATGQRPDIDLSVDETISRRHARIYARAGRYWLRDLESMNGTRYNGEWLQPGGEVVLSEGDEITLGEYCRIRVVDPALTTEDSDLRDLLQVALGGTFCAERDEDGSGLLEGLVTPQDEVTPPAPGEGQAAGSSSGSKRP